MSASPRETATDRIAHAHAAARDRLRGGRDWDRRRAEALQRLLAHGLPDRRDENWKYLDWPEIDRRRLALAPPSAVLPTAGALPALAPGRTVVIVDGRCFPGDGPDGLSGVEVLGLADAMEQDPAWVAGALRVPGDAADDRFALLAEAFTDDGIVIRVAEGAAPAGSLNVVHVGSGSGASHTRVLVDAGPRSRLQLVEHFLSSGDEPGLSNLSCELRLAEGASVDHLRLHGQGTAAAHVESLLATLARDSRYRQQLFMLGGRVLRTNVQVRLEGAAAECELDGLFMVDGSRQADLYTVIEHVAGRTRSAERVRGVATGRGRGAFNGRILVGPGAAGTDSSQSSRNLILSPLAEINVRPQLEILTDDVKCSHGAATGSLDPNQLFYLLSRGIDAGTARGLLTFAFCEDIVSRVALPALRRHIEELVVGRLPDRDVIREFV